MLKQALLVAIAIGVAICWAVPGSADTVGAIADAELRENGGIGLATATGVGTNLNINVRWNFERSPPDRNEWAALKFDLSAYPDKEVLNNVSLNVITFRADGANNAKNLHLYALVPGTPGEDWPESSITYDTMPGFTFDMNSQTNLLDVGGNLQDLGNFVTSSLPNFDLEGTTLPLTPVGLSEVVQGMGFQNLLTILITYNASSNGQFRFASREATSTSTGVLTGTEGSLAAFLKFDVESGSTVADYNGNNVIDAADYTIWRDTFGSTQDLRANGAKVGTSQGKIDQADYDVWKANFGQPGAGGLGVSGGIPEPSTHFLAVLATIGALVMRRRAEWTSRSRAGRT